MTDTVTVARKGDLAGFEVFDPVALGLRSRHVPFPAVSLGAQGSGRVLFVNRAAMAAINHPSSVTLHWSDRERAIGLRPAPDDDANAYRVRPNNGTPGVVAATAFCRRFGLMDIKARRLPARIAGDMLVAEIDHGKETTE